MIPRIEGTFYSQHRREVPTLPLEATAEPSLFTPVSVPLRKMIVMVDAAVLPPDQESRPPRSVLASLLDHPFVQCYRYAEDGQPSGLNAT